MNKVETKVKTRKTNKQKKKKLDINNSNLWVRRYLIDVSEGGKQKALLQQPTFLRILKPFVLCAGAGLDY